MGKFFLNALAAFVFIATNLFAQDWQTSYQQASTLYQSGDYEKSLTQAKLSLEQSKSAKDRAYTIQLITSNDLMLENADDGLKYIDEEIKLFKETEGTKSRSLAEALKKQILFLQQRGLAKEAVSKSGETLECFKNSYGASAAETVLLESSLGNLYLASGDSAKAKKVWDESLPKLSTITNAQGDYRETLFNSAALDENLKSYSSAKEKYLTLIGILEKANQTDIDSYQESEKAVERLKSYSQQSSNNNVEQLLKTALTLKNQHQTEKALEAYKKAVDEAAKENKNDKTTFSIYLNYAMLLTNVDDIKTAELYLQKAKSLSDVLFKSTDYEYFLVDLNIADLHLLQENKTQAIDEYTSLYKSVGNDVLKRAVSYLLNSSTNLLNENLPEVSKKLTKPLLALLTNIDSDFINITSNYCDALLAMNKPDSVLLLLSQQKFGNDVAFEFKRVEALQNSGRWSEALNKLNNLNALTNLNNQTKADIAYQSARVVYKMGDYAKAESYYKKANELYSNNGEDQWQVENSLAMLYAKLGNYEKSEKIIEELLTKVPSSHPLYSSLMENLAANYIESGEIEKAKPIESKIVAHDKATLGANHPDYAIALTNLAVLYQREKNYAEARKLLEEALTISKNNFGEQSTDYASKESNLGSIFYDMGDYNNAKNVLVHAQKILAEKLGKEHPDYIVCEYNLAMVYQYTGNVSQAIPLIQHVANFYKKQISVLFSSMNEQEQVAFFNKINKVIQDYQQMMIEYGKQKPELIGELLDFRLATKALLLNSSVRIRELILKGNNQQLKDQFMQWLLLKEKIGKLYNQPQNANTANQIVVLEEEANNIEKKLSLGSNQFKQNSDEQIITWKKIQETLQPNEAAIEMIRINASGKNDSISYAAIVIRKNLSQPTLVTFAQGKKMETREFTYYRNTTVSSIENLRSYTVFWKPLETSLTGVQNVYFSSDGVYNKINLSTLYDPTSKIFLGDRYQLILVSNLRNVISDKSTANERITTAQLYGPISFGVDNDDKENKPAASRSLVRSLVRGGKISELPGTQIEIESIDHLLKNSSWSTTDFLKSSASEQGFKNATHSSVLHIATHGFFVETINDDSPIVFSSTQANNNPLLRSGLVLSDVSNTTSEEDGLLTAYEVKNMNFDKTDLVVLSACETGSGEIRNGEGVYGLQRAFLVAGAKNVLMSLWKVDDEATKELMILFYKNMLGGQDRVSALRSAQIELRKKYAEPYYWGSFIIVGKP